MENTEAKLKEENKLKIFLKKDLKMKLLVGYLIINLLYLLIGSYIYFTEKIIKNFYYKEFSIGLKYLFIANIIVFLVILIKRKYKKSIVHIGIASAVLFGIISTLFAFDRNIALEGCWSRYEGLFSILYYLTLMLLSTQISKKYKKLLVNTIMICGIIQVIYAICQAFSLFNVKQIFHPTKMWDKSVGQIVRVNELWVLGFTNNPNFFGTYMLLCLSYSLGLFMDSEKKYINLIYAIFSILFMFGLLLSNTTNVAVGLIFVLIFIFVYCLKNKYYEKFLAVFVIILLTTCYTVIIGKTTLIKDFTKTRKEVTEITKGNLDDNYGSKRMYIWKETMKIVPNYLIHGVGIDSFHKAFNGEALILQKPTKRILFDKAHNEYLQTLVTQGIFSLASYLFIFGYAVYIGIKNSYRFKQIYLVLPVIGYLIQAFFNVSVIEVAPIFYIALGLCCGKENSK